MICLNSSSLLVHLCMRIDQDCDTLGNDDHGIPAVNQPKGGKRNEEK